MRLLSTSALLFATLLGAQFAQADIYTWVDANGVVNVSNLTPPKGADITNVAVERPQTSPRYDAAREAAREAEVLALAERVRELESDAQNAQRAPAPAVIAPIYVPVPSPVVVAYQPEAAPAVTAQQACDPSWLGCWTSMTGFYGPGVIVLPSSSSRRHVRTAIKPPGGPVIWPSGNLAALGPWAASAGRPHRPPHPAGGRR